MKGGGERKKAGEESSGSSCQRLSLAGIPAYAGKKKMIDVFRLSPRGVSLSLPLSFLSSSSVHSSASTVGVERSGGRLDLFVGVEGSLMSFL